MASKQKVMEMFAIFSTHYTNFAKDKSVKEMDVFIKSWLMVLKDYDDGEVDYAINQVLSTCQFAPKPADVITHIKQMRKSIAPSDEELWSVYENALRETCDQMSRFGYTFRENNGLTQGQIARNRVETIYNNLPPKIKEYVGSKGELMRLSQDWEADVDFARYEKSKFLKAMPSIEDKIECTNHLLLSNKAHDGELASHY